MAAFAVTENRETVTVMTPDIELSFSRDDGGLTALRRSGGPNVLGYGAPHPVINVQVGVEGVWLAERVFVRYLRHHVEQSEAAIELVIQIGIGPLILYDRYRITGTLLARRVSVMNVGEDEMQLRRVRLSLPWVRVGELDVCRFEAPGNGVRPHVPLAVAAAQRRNALPQQFFMPGRREGRALELAPIQSAGLMALHDTLTNEALLCWYYSETEPAQPAIEGNDTAITLMHESELADRLRSEVALSSGTQYILLLQASWPDALAAFQRTQQLAIARNAPSQKWLRDAAIYETHVAEFGGFAGFGAALGSLRRMGITTLCLLPIWLFEGNQGRLWDGSWSDSGDPYAICDWEQIDATLGTPHEFENFVALAHSLGMRVLVDLPVVGCGRSSRYIEERPEWLCRDALGELLAVPGSEHAVCMDWANPELLQYVVEQARAQAERYDLDGYRLVMSRVPVVNWTRRLPYHGSAGAQGALRVFDQLGTALRTWKPDAVLVSSLGGPAYTFAADCAIDEMAHHQFINMALDRLAPAELGEWLDNHIASLPLGAVRICFTESYATRVINPLADGLRGSPISRMLLSGMLFCGFVPMVRYQQDYADDEFIGRLLRTLATYHALRTGASFFNRITANSSQVFAVLRQGAGQQIVCVLNVGPHRQSVQLQLPLDIMRLPEGAYAFDELIGGTEWNNGGLVWQRDELSAITLSLEPYGAYCLLVQLVPDTASALPHELSERRKVVVANQLLVGDTPYRIDHASNSAVE